MLRLESKLLAAFLSLTGDEALAADLAAAALPVVKSVKDERYHELLAACRQLGFRIGASGTLILTDTVVGVVVVETGGTLVMNGRSKAGRVEKGT